MSVHALTATINLPPELVRKIFFHAARSSTSSCRTLCKVSKWTRQLALPHLYTTVSISYATVTQFLSSMTTPLILPPNVTFHPPDSVQNLLITVVSEKLGALVQCCSNISHIALHAYSLPWLIRGGVLRATGADGRHDLDILIFNNHPRPDWSFHHYFRPMNNLFFDRITRLRLEDPEPFHTQLQLQYMRRLTHLAVPCGSVDVKDLACALSVFQNTSIEVLVLIVSREHLTEDQCRDVEDWARTVRIAEERIYVVRPLCDCLKMEWEAEVRSGITIWERASEYTRLLMSCV